MLSKPPSPWADLRLLPSTGINVESGMNLDSVRRSTGVEPVQAHVRRLRQFGEDGRS